MKMLPTRLYTLLILALAFVANVGTMQASEGPLTVILVETDGQQWSLDIQRDSVWQRFVFPLSAFGSGDDFLNSPVATFRLVPVGGGTIGGPVFEVADWIDDIILGDSLIDDFEDGSYADWHPNVALNGSYLGVDADPSTPNASLRCLKLRHGNTLFGNFAGWMDKYLNSLSLAANDTLRLWLRGYGYMVSGVVEPPGEVPASFTLQQNYPNPFNPLTSIRYQLPMNCYVTLKIYDLLGRDVATLVDEFQDAGYKSIDWNPSTISGQVLASGTYLCRLTAGGYQRSIRMVLLR